MINDRAVASRSGRGFFTAMTRVSVAAGLLGVSLPALAASDAECPPPQTRMYTLKPADFFILSRVMAKDGSPSSRRSFDATVFRGHLERDPHQVISGLDKVEVEVQKLVYGVELTAQSASRSDLTYIVF